MDPGGIFQQFLGEIVFSHVDMAPSGWHMNSNGATPVFAGFSSWRFFEMSGEIQVIPEDDAILDDAVASFGDLLFFLFFLFDLDELMGVRQQLRV